MKKHFDFKKMEFKSINGKPIRIGTHRFNGVALFDGENYSYNMFSQGFIRDELFTGQIWVSDYMMREEDINDMIESHLLWLFSNPTQEEIDDKNKRLDDDDIIKPNFAT